MPIRATWLALALAAVACGGPQKPAATTDTTAVPEPSVAAASVGSAADSAAATPAGAAATVAQAMAPPSSPGTFRHDLHRGLPCQRCHTAVAGHEFHAGVSCTACHAPVAAAGPPATGAQCGACHHAGTQHRACTTCHNPGSRGALPFQVTWKLSVWPAPRQREVTFDHRWHKGLPCTSCHRDPPALLPRQDCASCHVHHSGVVDCRVCHRSPPAGVHTVAAHNGCAGSGCHQNPPVKVATLSRDECLLCHSDRVNHQPGRACAQCHMLQPARGPPDGEDPKPR